MTDRFGGHLRPDRRDRRVCHPGGRREGQGTQGRRPAGHRLRRGRARLPDSGLHRRGGAAGVRGAAVSQVHPGRGPAGAARGRGRQDGRAIPVSRFSASQVLITNGGKQAVYETFATLLDPGDEVLMPTPYWTTYPESIGLAGGVPVEVMTDETTGLPDVGRAARGALHRPDQAAPVRLAVQPDRCGLPAGRGRRDRPLGGQPRPLGRYRRDLRAPRLRRRQVRLDAGGSARDRGPVRGAERGRQDVRDDGLAGRLDDRPGRGDQGGRQPAVARDLERLQRRPGRRAGGGVRRPVRGRHDAGRVRPAAPAHDRDAQRGARRALPAARRARSTAIRR